MTNKTIVEDTSLLLPDTLPDSPLEMMTDWLAIARAANFRPNPDAMILATCRRDGAPSSRVVLCREIGVKHGYLVFFTNYNSAKARELAENPRAAATFHWDQLYRQIRVQGHIVRSPAAESDAYFARRPWPRQLGAIASDQSEPIESRKAMQKKVDECVARLGLDLAGLEKQPTQPAEIERPAHWGGYRLWLSSVELWIEGAGRIHDRGLWLRDIELVDGEVRVTGHWQSTRLQP